MQARGSRITVDFDYRILEKYLAACVHLLSNRGEHQTPEIGKPHFRLHKFSATQTKQHKMNRDNGSAPDNNNNNMNMNNNSKHPAEIDDKESDDSERHNNDTDDNDMDDHDDDDHGVVSTGDEQQQEHHNQTHGDGQSRKLKRLHMNRESARARRKRKKVLMESLEQQVSDLMKRNQVYRLVNESLTTQVQQLESDLAVANATIVMLRTNNSNAAAANGSNNGSLSSSQQQQQSHLFGGGNAANVSNAAGDMMSSHSASSSNDSAIHRFLASQHSRRASGNLFHNTALSAQDYGLFGNSNRSGSNVNGCTSSSSQDNMQQHRQRDLQSQLSQVNIDRVLANLLQQQQQQQQHLAASPRHDRASVNQYSSLPPNDTLASAVEMGRLRAIGQRLDHVGGAETIALDSPNVADDSRRKAYDAILKYQQQQQQQYQQQHQQQFHKQHHYEQGKQKDNDNNL
ncbi:hypothetical protein MPSEU_000549400 [Mayamaea pseudoterrestris]|nr:hypothetical protein MPSEU_000549400 [Mayamaea pseudoterrestris]